MLLEILFFPIVLALVYVVPYLGVTHSEKNNKRWLGHWLVTVFAVNAIVPVLSWMIADWMMQFFLITLTIALLFAFTNDKADQVFGVVDSIVGVVQGQLSMIQEKVNTQLKQLQLKE